MWIYIECVCDWLRGGLLGRKVVGVENLGFCLSVFGNGKWCVEGWLVCWFVCFGIVLMLGGGWVVLSDYKWKY